MLLSGTTVPAAAGGELGDAWYTAGTVNGVPEMICLPDLDNVNQVFIHTIVNLNSFILKITYKLKSRIVTHLALHVRVDGLDGSNSYALRVTKTTPCNNVVAYDLYQRIRQPLADRWFVIILNYALYKRVCRGKRTWKGGAAPRWSQPLST